MPWLLMTSQRKEPRHHAATIALTQLSRNIFRFQQQKDWSTLGANFINDFPVMIQIRWKIPFTLICRYKILHIRDMYVW